MSYLPREHSKSTRTSNYRYFPVNITAVAGSSVDLRCRVDLHECGNFYSIEWYKESSNGHRTSSSSSPGAASRRVYVYRHHSGLAKAEHGWRRRARHSYDSRWAFHTKLED